MKKIKIGLLGCGKIARVSHAPAFLDIPGKAEIIALYDLNKKAAQKLKKEHLLNATICSTVKELLASGVDGIVISTPNNSHYQLTVDALKTGVHVLVEKPMATNLKEADKMIALARKNKRILQVNQSLRFSPPYVKIKELIESGKIGQPIHIRCLRAGGNSPDKGWSPGASWFVKKKFHGGIIMDIAVHMADMMGWYFGKTRKIYAINSTRIKGNDVPDNANALFDFANGATGILELSWTIPSGGGLLEIYGTKGTIRMGFRNNDIELSVNGGKYKIVKSKKVKNSHTCFVDAIRGTAPTPVPGEVGRHALAYSLAIHKAGITGKATIPQL